MHFVKMHGIGNDYIYLDAVTAPALAERSDLPDLARRMSDRHTGIGSDGLILVCRPTPPSAPSPPSRAHVRMRMFNSDGSESEMCGNGIRCVAKFAHDRLGIGANPMLVETGRGVLSIAHETSGGRLTRATVDMGEPILEPGKIPVDLGHVVAGERAHEFRIDLSTRQFKFECDAVFVSMGNPHAVVFQPPDLPDPSGRGTGAEQITFSQALNELGRFGSWIEHHPAFPNRINVHLVSLQTDRLPRSEATMRTWERGAGLTQACGTGACAVLVAGVLTGRLRRESLLHLPGGDLTVRWDEKTNHVFMTGPAADVFEGEWPEG